MTYIVEQSVVVKLQPLARFLLLQRLTNQDGKDIKTIGRYRLLHELPPNLVNDFLRGAVLVQLLDGQFGDPREDTNNDGRHESREGREERHISIPCIQDGFTLRRAWAEVIVESDATNDFESRQRFGQVQFRLYRIKTYVQAGMY